MTKSNNIIQNNVFKIKNQYIIYNLNIKKSDKLVIFFPSVDTIPTRNVMSYYAFSEGLNANVLHIVDNFGSHGNYLYSFINQTIQLSVYELIKKILQELNVSLNNTYFVGSSKGGFCAIYYSLLFGNGNVIAGEPQIKLGDFLFRKGWESKEDCRAIIYAMTGQVNKSDQEKLNSILYSITSTSESYQGNITVHYGIGTSYYNLHIKYINEIILGYGGSMSQVNFVEHDIASHNEIIPIFMKELNVLNDTALRPMVIKKTNLASQANKLLKFLKRS